MSDLVATKNVWKYVAQTGAWYFVSFSLEEVRKLLHKVYQRKQVGDKFLSTLLLDK